MGSAEPMEPMLTTPLKSCGKVANLRTSLCFLGADNQFNLVCDVEDGAEPEPVIEWLKNGEVILKDSIQGIVISDEKIDFIGKV